MISVLVCLFGWTIALEVLGLDKGVLVPGGVFVVVVGVIFFVASRSNSLLCPVYKCRFFRNERLIKPWMLTKRCGNCKSRIGELPNQNEPHGEDDRTRHL